MLIYIFAEHYPNPYKPQFDTEFVFLLRQGHEIRIFGEKDWGYVADTYPVKAAEIGFMAAGDPGAHNPVIADEDYGRRITAYFEKKGISWTAWCFDPDWGPTLISDWSFTPTEQGRLWRAALLGQPLPAE